MSALRLLPHFMRAGNIIGSIMLIPREDLAEMIRIKSVYPPGISDAARRLSDESLAETKLLLFLRDELEKVRMSDADRAALIEQFDAEMPAHIRTVRDALLGKGPQ